MPETIRLFVDADLSAGASLALDTPQAHYLLNVLRRGAGDSLRLFNGRDGEWQARIESAGRGRCTVLVAERTAEQPSGESDLWLLFAPVKRAPIDMIATKATELGVSALWPVFTRHTAVTRVNSNRLRANAIEAAEQTGRLSVPEIMEPKSLGDVLASWPADRSLMVCDETGAAPPIADALKDQRAGKWAVLIGPEGGFAQSELDGLAKLPFVTRVGLGPRVLRADTAAIAALACFQALAGDWRAPGGTRP